MLKINKNYRSTYFHESIIKERVYENGTWHSTVETVQNAVDNNQISNQAVVFGNGLSRERFDSKLVLNHAGGLLGSTKLQTYGCNAIYRDMAVDFLIASSREMALELSSTRYVDTNIVYTGATNMLEFPKQFYLIPNDPYADSGTTAMYIAAFDGHKKIFMLGFDGQDTAEFNNNVYADTRAYDPSNFTVNDKKWVFNRNELISTYDDVDFVWVTETGRCTIPEMLKYNTNFRQISFRDFVLEASL